MRKLTKALDSQYPFLGIEEIRKTARGVLLNELGEVALVRLQGQDVFGNRNYYELPGGGVEKKESIKHALIREIEEETGYIGEIICELGMVESSYNLIKQSNFNYYYLLKIVKEGTKHLDTFESTYFGSIEWQDIDTAIKKMESNIDEGLAKVVKDRELQVLKIAKKKIEEKKAKLVF